MNPASPRGPAIHPAGVLASAAALLVLAALLALLVQSIAHDFDGSGAAVGLMSIDPASAPHAPRAPRGAGAAHAEPAAESKVASNALSHDGIPAPRRSADGALASPPADDALQVPTAFDGRPLRKLRDMQMLVTAYSPDSRSCGRWADGITASGFSVWTNGMSLVAADTSLLPFGSLVSIPGYAGGGAVPVLDRGGRIKGDRLDVLYPTHEQALEWGVRRLTVTVWEYADQE